MRIIILVLFLLLMAAASSCLVFPTQLADENPYGNQSIGFIVLNETPRTDLSATLGAPIRTFANGRWWLYQSDRRMTTWFLFVGALAGGGSATEFGGHIRIYSLIVEFSDNDIVSNLIVITDRDPCSKDKSICYADGELIVANKSTTAAQTYHDQSPNAPLSDARLLALRGKKIERFLALQESGDEVELVEQRFSATSENGEQLELVERGGLVFDALSMKLCTGQISRSFGDTVATLSYKEGLLHGPTVVRDANGTVLMEAYYEHGQVPVSDENS